MEQRCMSNGVKVMSDEQTEILRKQICVYTTICEQLVEMHKAITAQQHLPGMRLPNNLYCHPLITPSSSSSGHMITARQRWSPTPLQLQILERIFDKGNGTPTKHDIKHITIQLSQHGQISETKVYNWFQNRRSRSKRKNHLPSQPHSPKHKIIQLQPSPPPSPSPSSTPQSPQDICFHTPDIGIDQLMSQIEVADCYSPYFQAEMHELSDW